MGIWLQLILTAYFVNSGWTLVRLHESISDQAAVLSNVDNAGRIQGNVLNLFNSIAKNNVKTSETYQKIVKHEITAEEQQTFNKMKEELWIAQYRNVNKNRNFYKGSNAGKDKVLIKREPNPLQLKEEENDSAPSGPLQFNDAVCKKICVTAIGDVLDAFHNFQDKFIDELRLANESMAYDISEKLGELSRKVFQRKLLLMRVKEKTPCDCEDEFIKVEGFEDNIDEAYDFLLIRFDKIDKEEVYYSHTTYQTTTPRHYNDYMGFWKGRVMHHPSTHDPFADNIIV